MRSSFKVKLTLSYFLLVFISLGFIALFLIKNLDGKTLQEIKSTFIIGLFFTLGLSFVLGSVLAKALIGPINRIIHVSSKFAQGDFSRRIFYSSSDEIGRLALTLNKMAQDIEEKIREIATKNQHLEAIFNSMVEGVIVTDKSSRVISINHTIEKLFDVTKGQTEEKLFLEGIRNSQISEVIANATNSAKLISEEIILVTPAKSVVQINASPIFEKDKVTGCVAVIHDITQLRQLETMRRDFVANVSHELKTPLTSIKGFVETLIDGAVDDKKNSRGFLKIIQEHVERLGNLVDDLLDLSYIESKEAILGLCKFDLSQLAKEVILAFSSKSSKYKIEISNNIFSGAFLNADKDKIGQVLANLIDNAIKFNKERGAITILSEDLGSEVKVTVEDSGQGIPVKDIPRIFERFYRVDKARSRQLGGTGLGLSIVKHIIELHGGRVGVESNEGLGSKFWFILPK